MTDNPEQQETTKSSLKRSNGETKPKKTVRMAAKLAEASKPTSIFGLPVKGIITLLGGFLVQFTFGSYYSFANVMPYLVSYMRVHACPSLSYGDFVVVQSAWGITQGLVLPFAGPLVQYLGPIKAVVLGSLLFALAPILTTLTINEHLGLVVLSYGVISAVGQNVAMLPTVVLPMAWFPHRRGLVTGVVVSGLGAGSFFFNFVQTRVANPGDVAVDHNGYFVDPDVIQRVPFLLQTMASIFLGLLVVGSVCLLSFVPPKSLHPEPQEKPFFFIKITRDASGLELCALDPKQPLRLRLWRKLPLIIRKALSKREFYLLWLSRFGMVLIAQCVAGMYKAFGLENLKLNDDFLTKVGAVAGIFNLASRLVFGVLIDHFSYKKLMVLEALGMTALLASFYWLANLSPICFAGALWLSFFGFSGIFAMHPAVCSQIFGPKVDSAAIGMIGSSDVVNNLIIGIFSEFLLSTVGWPGYFLAASSMGVLVTVVTLLLPDRNLNRFRVTQDQLRAIEAQQQRAKQFQTETQDNDATNR